MAIKNGRRPARGLASRRSARLTFLVLLFSKVFFSSTARRLAPSHYVSFPPFTLPFVLLLLSTNFFFSLNFFISYLSKDGSRKPGTIFGKNDYGLSVQIHVSQKLLVLLVKFWHIFKRYTVNKFADLSAINI